MFSILLNPQGSFFPFSFPFRIFLSLFKSPWLSSPYPLKTAKAQKFSRAFLVPQTPTSIPLPFPRIPNPKLVYQTTKKTRKNFFKSEKTGCEKWYLIRNSSPASVRERRTGFRSCKEVLGDLMGTVTMWCWGRWVFAEL